MVDPVSMPLDLPKPQRAPHSRRRTTGSLSPANATKPISQNDPPQPSRRKRASGRFQCALAMSRAETVLVSATGDVLVSRSRSSPYAIVEHPIISGKSAASKEDNNTTWWRSGDNSLCGMCIPGDDDPHSSGGLLGGAAQVANEIVKAESETKREEDERVLLERQTVEKMYPDLPSDADEESILPLPSFDYSHFTEGGNDMESISAPRRRTHSGQLSPLHENSISHGHILDDETTERPARQLTPPLVMHGVPTFLPAFSQIRVTKVSAHPLGSHMLLISSAALLFSCGLNDNGQLGLGRKTPIDGKTKGFVTTPTIVTPLLENGGKATVCAAGVNNSLVVVKTEGRRVGRFRRLSRAMTSSLSSVDTVKENGEPYPSRGDASTSVWHHQLYGFGGNECQKLGLVNTKESAENDVLLPRRVALHCNVFQGTDDANGIFAIAASSHHSAALVRLSTGTTEVYTWGNAGDGALGHCEKVTSGIVPVPTIVPSLSTESSEKDRPVQLAVGPVSTFVVTSAGRCLSFGSSDGLLGHGRNAMYVAQPKEIVFPSSGHGGTEIRSVSVGARHAVAIAADGRAFTWGDSSHGRTGLGGGRAEFLPITNGRDRSRVHANPSIEYTPQQVKISRPTRDIDLRKVSRRRVLSDSQLGEAVALCRLDDGPPRAEHKSTDRFATACAGYDGTVFLTESGSVLSCGKGSGRLAQGSKTSDSLHPAKVFGGLYLWR